MKTIPLFTSWMHLGDEALAGAALQQQALRHESDDTPSLSAAAQAHLADCPHCQARLDDLFVRLDAQRQRAADLADASFPQARLDAQRNSILTRLAARHAGARVLMFPTHVVPEPGFSGAPLPRRALAHAGQPSMRWIAATVAASLFVGLMTGQVLYLRDQIVRHVATQTAQTRPHIPRHNQRYTVESGPDAQPGSEPDDRLLGEIESAVVSRRRNPALRALDDLTPRAPGNDPPSRRYRER